MQSRTGPAPEQARVESGGSVLGSWMDRTRTTIVWTPRSRSQGERPRGASPAPGSLFQLSCDTALLSLPHTDDAFWDGPCVLHKCAPCTHSLFDCVLWSAVLGDDSSTHHGWIFLAAEQSLARPGPDQSLLWGCRASVRVFGCGSARVLSFTPGRGSRPRNVQACAGLPPRCDVNAPGAEDVSCFTTSPTQHLRLGSSPASINNEVEHPLWFEVFGAIWITPLGRRLSRPVSIFCVKGCLYFPLEL